MGPTAVRLLTFMVVMFSVFLTACAQTRHVTREMNVGKSGFLGPELYSKLTRGNEENLEPAFRWRDPTVDPQQYTKLMLDPIVLFRQPHHLGGGNTNENAQKLINYFHARLVEALSRYMALVDKPAPGVGRLQIVLTDYEQSWVALDMVSTLYPMARVVVEAQALALEKPTFAGAVEVEFKVSYSLSGQVLMAGIDRRVGGKTLTKGISRWSDVQNVIDFWALQGAYRFCKVSGQANCLKPTYGIAGTLKTEPEK